MYVSYWPSGSHILINKTRVCVGVCVILCYNNTVCVVAEKHSFKSTYSRKNGEINFVMEVATTLE